MEELIQQKKHEPGFRILASLRDRLRLRRETLLRYHIEQHAVDEPLDDQEEQLFSLIERQTAQGIEMAGVPHQQAAELFGAVIKPYGRKNTVALYAEPTLILGVPFKYFLANVAIGMLMLLLTRHLALIMPAIAAIHAACYVYYVRHRDRLRSKNVARLLAEGIKMEA